MNQSVITNSPLLSIKPITFSNEDVCGMYFPYNGALVIAIHIGNCKVAKVLIDTDSSVNIVYGQTLDQMEDIQETTRSNLFAVGIPLRLRR